MKAKLLLAMSLLCFCLGFGQKPPGKFYVYATNGLNLRAKSAADSPKISTVGYGEEVEILQAAEGGLLVDGISGGMAKVRYKGQEGYMFDGYLVPYPAPRQGEDLEQYAARLWEAGANIMKEKVERDYGGYFQAENAIYISDISWSEAFLLAKNLFGIPAPLQFPGEKGNEDKVSKNPNASRDTWTDELRGTYNQGKMFNFYYSYRAEATGRVVGVEATTRDNFDLRIYELGIAD